MEDLIAWLGSWPNPLFLLPLITGLLLILLDTFLGGLGDLDLDVDVDADADLEAGGTMGHALSWLGVGRVPVSMLVQLLSLSFGATGLLVSAMASDFTGLPRSVVTLAALAAATLTAVVVTRAVGGFVATHAPGDTTTSRQPSDFVGEVGRSSSRITTAVGQVRLEAAGGHPPTVLSACVAGSPIPRATPVLITGFDAARNLYTVTPIQEQK